MRIFRCLEKFGIVILFTVLLFNRAMADENKKYKVVGKALQIPDDEVPDSWVPSSTIGDDKYSNVTHFFRGFDREVMRLVVPKDSKGEFEIQVIDEGKVIAKISYDGAETKVEEPVNRQKYSLAVTIEDTGKKYICYKRDGKFYECLFLRGKHSGLISSEEYGARMLGLVK